jgi:hypothetical protein
MSTHSKLKEVNEKDVSAVTPAEVRELSAVKGPKEA